MKKFFTLALASAAVLSASASHPAAPVMLGQALAFEGEKVATDDSMLENSGIVSRAEDLANDGYLTATYTRYPNTKNPGGAPYSMLTTCNDISIKADPEVENGYIIENFLYGMFFNDENPGTVSKLKATYDAERQVLSIAPHQLLLNYTFQDGQTVPLDLIAVDNKNYYNPEVPIEFSYRYGQLRLNAETTQAMAFLQVLEDDGSGNQFFGVDFAVFDFVAYVPNGTMTYYNLSAGEEQSCPIYGVNANGRNAIYNFGGYDRFHFAPLMRDGDKVKTPKAENIEDLIPTTQVILNNPDFVKEPIVDVFYLTRIDSEDFYPYYDDGFYIEGDIVVNRPDECVITLPTCGLFSADDTPLNCFDDVEISYNPNAITGIESVDAVDNANAPVVYYNLQGVRVSNPQGGIFIRQQGTEATKVLVK